MNKIKLTYQTIKNYLSGKLSSKDRHALEKESMRDPFEEDALEGLSSLTASEFEADIATLTTKINQRTEQKNDSNTFFVYKIAASILVIIGIVSVFYFSQPKEESTDFVVSPEYKKQQEDEIVFTDDVKEQDNIESEEKLFQSKPEIEPILSSKRKPVVTKDSVIKRNFQETSLKSAPVVVTNDQKVSRTGKSPSLNDIVEVEESVIVESEKINDISDNAENEEKTEEAIIKTIVGKVTDETGAPLPGASIKINNSGKEIYTNFDGNFKLNVSEGDRVRVSYVGYQPQIAVVNNIDSLNFNLEEDISALNDAVVVGYGTKKRSEVTGAVITVKSEELSKRSNLNAEEILNSKAAGVQVQSAFISAIPPQGNREAFKNYIINQLKLSNFESQQKYQVKTSFIVEKSGKITSFKVLNNDILKDIKKDFKRIFSNLKNWKPATSNSETTQEKILMTFEIVKD